MRINGQELPVAATIDNNTETATLKVRVHSELAGRFLAPEIVLGGVNLTRRITLEKGAQGCRYLPVDHRLAANRAIGIETPLSLNDVDAGAAKGPCYWRKARR